MVIHKLGQKGTQELSTVMILITLKQFSLIMGETMFQQLSIQFSILSQSPCLNNSEELPISTFLLLHVFHLSVAAPLVAVIGATMVKEAVEDWRRRKQVKVSAFCFLINATLCI